MIKNEPTTQEPESECQSERARCVLSGTVVMWRKKPDEVHLGRWPARPGRGNCGPQSKRVLADPKDISGEETWTT